MMEPGPELDAKVCVAVGIEIERKWVSAVQDYEPAYPLVSTDLAAAWQVVEALRKKDYGLSLHYPAAEGERAYADFYQSISWADYGATVPEAICRAALKALRVDA